MTTERYEREAERVKENIRAARRVSAYSTANGKPCPRHNYTDPHGYRRAGMGLCSAAGRRVRLWAGWRARMVCALSVGEDDDMKVDHKCWQSLCVKWADDDSVFCSEHRA